MASIDQVLATQARQRNDKRDRAALRRRTGHPLFDYLAGLGTPAAQRALGDPTQTPALNAAEVERIRRSRTPGTEEWWDAQVRAGNDPDLMLAHYARTGRMPQQDLPEEQAREGVMSALNALGGGFSGQLAGLVSPPGAGALGATGVLRPKAEDALTKFGMGQGGSVAGTLDPVTRGRTRFRGGRERSVYPGIYADPVQLAQHAEARVAPESGSLSRLFGTTRRELSETALARQSAPEGWAPGDPDVWIPSGTKLRGKGAAVGERIWTPSNVRRLTEATEAAREHAPGLWEGMTGWYVSDPMYRRMVDLMGPEEATKEFLRRENLIGMASPGAPVPLEVNRGSVAAWLAKQGRFPEFAEFGGNPAKRFQPPRPGQNYPVYDPWAFDPELRGLQGHPYHSTSQALPMERYLESGQFGEAAKVPSYVHAWHPSSFPSWQGHYPVGDAHWSRAMGLADVRPGKGYAQSATTPEMTYLAPRYDLMARELGLQGVPQQALHWGLFSPQTGVKTEVGVPKLELIADMMEKQAARDRVPVSRVRDMYLMGELPLTAY